MHERTSASLKILQQKLNTLLFLQQTNKPKIRLVNKNANLFSKDKSTLDKNL